MVKFFATPLKKYDFVSWDDDIPNIWKNKKCSTPPTRYKLNPNESFTPILAGSELNYPKYSRLKLSCLLQCGAPQL